MKGGFYGGLSHGVLQNLTVIPQTATSYTVIIGHRRLAASKLAGLTELPCVITEMDERKQIATMLLENMQRSDLTVYEQAQGFQMMLDFGSTVKEISEKSGFSAATVRRRVKMMELDQDKLKEVSDRQIAFTDFDRLAQIDDIDERNKCLEEIGTSSFDQSVATQLRRQEITKNLPFVKKLLKEAKAKALKQSETWGGKYDGIGSYIHIAEWKEGAPLLPEKASGQLFYYLDEKYGSLRFFEAHKRAAPVKKTAKEIEREKRIAAVWAALEEKTAVSYDLRSTFVKNLSCSKKNAEPILRGAVIFGLLKVFDYITSDSNEIEKMLSLDMSKYDSARSTKAIAALHELSETHVPSIIYAMFSDSSTEGLTQASMGGSAETPSVYVDIGENSNAVALEALGANRATKTYSNIKWEARIKKVTGSCTLNGSGNTVTTEWYSMDGIGYPSAAVKVVGSPNVIRLRLRAGVTGYLNTYSINLKFSLH